MQSARQRAKFGFVLRELLGIFPTRVSLQRTGSDSFVRWQFVRLKERNKIKFGKRYTIFRLVTIPCYLMI